MLLYNVAMLLQWPHPRCLPYSLPEPPCCLRISWVEKVCFPIWGWRMGLEKLTFCFSNIVWVTKNSDLNKPGGRFFECLLNLIQYKISVKNPKTIIAHMMDVSPIFESKKVCHPFVCCVFLYSTHFVYLVWKAWLFKNNGPTFNIKWIKSTQQQEKFFL